MHLTNTELYNTLQDDDSDALYTSMHKQYKLSLQREAERSEYYENVITPESDNDITTINLFLSAQQYRLVMAEQYNKIDILETRIALKEKGLYK